jgi:hypothetical protein
MSIRDWSSLPFILLLFYQLPTSIVVAPSRCLHLCCSPNSTIRSGFRHPVCHCSPKSLPVWFGLQIEVALQIATRR